MKYYELQDEIPFGKYAGKTIDQLATQDAPFLEWCLWNLDHFLIPSETVQEIEWLNPEFNVTSRMDMRLLQKDEYYETMVSDIHLIVRGLKPMNEDLLDTEPFGGNSEEDWLETKQSRFPVPVLPSEIRPKSKQPNQENVEGFDFGDFKLPD